MWDIKDGTDIIARGDNILNYQKGRHFLSDPEEALQYAVFNLSNGGVLGRHIHLEHLAASEWRATYEYFLLWSGLLSVTFFNSDKVDITSRLLYPGDFFCQSSGGHGFKALSPDTLFIEVKHGPFIGVKNDKEKF